MTTPFPFQSAAVLTAAQMNAITTLPINDQTASYVALVGDVGKRIIMNVGSANTLTINNSVFAVGDTIFIANKGAGATTITAGAGVTINGTLTVAQHGGGTLVALSASVFTFFSGGGGTGYGVATGGTSSSITVSSVNYTLLTFTATGLLTVTTAGFFDYLLVGGGGGSMKNIAAEAGGGGGAGQIRQGSVYLSANQTVTVGAGGGIFDMAENATEIFTQGVATSIGSLISASGNVSRANPNGSTLWFTGGGAGGSASTARSNITESAFQGFQGGTSSSANNGGGGGGNTARGSNGGTTTGGAAGAGFDVSAFISGSALFKAMGGGGGGSITGGTAATGGVAGSTGTTPSAGNANSGGGGGGGFGVTTTGSGGSGIAYVRFRV